MRSLAWMFLYWYRRNGIVSIQKCMAMNWDDLRFFLAIARAGSLTAAARALRVSQPTV